MLSRLVSQTFSNGGTPEITFTSQGTPDNNHYTHSSQYISMVYNNLLNLKVIIYGTLSLVKSTQN